MARDAKRAQSRLEAAVLARLRETMKDKGMRQYQLAETVKLSEGQLADIFNGRKPATFTEMVDIAAALGADLAAIVADVEANRGAAVPASAEVDAMILEADLEEERAKDGPHPIG